jgi:polyisoprenoid-binding protein YceI
MTTATDSTTRTRSAVPTGIWRVDPAHSSVQFAVKHMGIATVRGKFTRFEGTLDVGEELSSSKAYGKVDVSSIDTDEPDRDAHLRSADFFDVEHYPEITYESTRVVPLDRDSSTVYGNLTMHGVTKEVRLEVAVEGTDTDPWGNERVGLAASGTLKRSDFDMKFNQALGSGNMLVGDKVTISLDISAVKEPTTEESR